mmetsp:Transcript_35217/g.61499  ORF Transcript_35217/g.61499 Transcript_35217/m.61499 type:complete len:415 (-) Transcript_35217:291-1535(-)
MFDSHALFASIGAASMAVGVGMYQMLPSEIKLGALAVFCLVVPGLILRDYLGRYETAHPDEWQLLIRKGKLEDAGVGACHFRGIRDSIVRFPSAINKVSFRVEQVTSEMQGVVVTGFALWTVHREGDGPWKAYKNLVMRDLDRDGNLDQNTGNTHISDMATSIIRVSIAQQTLSDCMTKRDEIRDTVREQMMKQLVGWGVWLETVEISDVRVASKALFQDLQCEFRSEQRLRAERVRLATERKLQEEQLVADLNAAQRRAETETSKAVTIARENLKRDQQQAELLLAQEEVQKQRLEREEAMKMAQLASEWRVEVERKRNAAAARAVEHEAELARKRAEDARVAALSDRNLEALRMEVCKEVYQGVKNATIHSFVGGGAGDQQGPTPAGMLPGLGALAQQWEVLRSTAGTPSSS